MLADLLPVLFLMLGGGVLGWAIKTVLTRRDAVRRAETDPGIDEEALARAEATVDRTPSGPDGRGGLPPGGTTGL
jgi:hypothetical protein